MVTNDRSRVRCENTQTEITVVNGTTLKELLQYLPLEGSDSYIAAYVNNKSKDLNYVVNNNLTVRFITQNHFEGSRVYRRTLIFILSKVIEELYPHLTLKVQFSVGLGAYFVLEGADGIVDLSEEIKQRMSHYIERNISIDREMIHADELKEIFNNHGRQDRVELIDSLHYLYFTANTMDETTGFMYGTLASSTACVKLFDIEKFYNGYVLVLPSRSGASKLEESPKNRKMHEVFSVHKRWMNILGVSTIGQLNRRVQQGDAADLVKVAEALQEKQISSLADLIFEKYHEGARVVMLSGPSSSGKTTSSYRLSIQLRVLGLEPVIIGMDNYFVNREDTPLDEKGRYDYERLEAVDISFFNKQINQLLSGEEVEIPTFNFIEGRREFKGNRVKMKSNSIIVTEGIHALNPASTSMVDRDKLFKLFVSAMTSIAMDNTSYMCTTDNRLIRRIVRDYQFRGCSALDTLKRWGSVRLGEEKYIFPYQNEADYQFNSALFYEIGVLRPLIEPLLRQVPQDSEEYGEAHRLMEILEYFTPIPIDIVPSTSLLKEFTGGSSFEIK